MINTPTESAPVTYAYIPGPLKHVEGTLLSDLCQQLSIS